MKYKAQIVMIVTVILLFILLFTIFFTENRSDKDKIYVSFPDDEWPHDEEVEWHYWTGHLQTKENQWFGYELVFFIYNTDGQRSIAAHHAITDIQNNSFHYTLEFSTNPVPILGEALELRTGLFSALINNSYDLLYAEVDNYSINLKLESLKAPVLQHENGYNAYPFGGYTYYYSKTRMDTIGTITVNNESYEVNGTSWFDHQWGSLVTATDLGWDWYAIQLDDGREIMLFNVHYGDGGLLVGGSLIDVSGNATEILPEEFTAVVIDEWVSPHTGRTYPSGWEIKVKDIDLILMPVIKDQELAFTNHTRYWEGACIVEGDATGRAYVELTKGGTVSRFETGENILENSDFENGTSENPFNWYKATIPNENLTMSWDTEIKYTGNRSIAINNTHIYSEPVYNNWRQTIENIPVGRNIELSGWIKTIDAENVFMMVACWDKDDNLVGSGNTQWTINITGTTDWQIYNVSTNVPNETNRITVMLMLEGTGQVWFDNVKAIVL